MDFVKPKRAVQRVFIHCSAANRPEFDDVSIIDEWHKKRGWSGVGYHLFIKADGTVQAGRDLEKKPASAKGHNTGTIAICLHGLYEHDFTTDQYASLITLCNQINHEYAGKVTFHGHCEVSTKPCPVFDYTMVLNLDHNGKILKVETRTRLETFHTGTDVMDIQRRLNIFFVEGNHIDKDDDVYEIDVDGIFGQITTQSILFFQLASQLTPDGIAGPKTRLRLPRIPVSEEEEETDNEK